VLENWEYVLNTGLNYIKEYVNSDNYLKNWKNFNWESWKLLFSWITANYFWNLNLTNVNASYDIKNLYAQWFWWWTSITFDGNIPKEKIISNNSSDDNEWYENWYTFDNNINYNYVWTDKLNWVYIKYWNDKIYSWIILTWDWWHNTINFTIKNYNFLQNWWSTFEQYWYINNYFYDKQILWNAAITIKQAKEWKWMFLYWKKISSTINKSIRNYPLDRWISIWFNIPLNIPADENGNNIDNIWNLLEWNVFRKNWF